HKLRSVADIVSPQPVTTAIYTLSLPDALPIYQPVHQGNRPGRARRQAARARAGGRPVRPGARRRGDRPGGRRLLPRYAHQGRNRSEEHTSELQSRENLVCRLLLEKKKKKEDIT